MKLLKTLLKYKKSFIFLACLSFLIFISFNSNENKIERKFELKKSETIVEDFEMMKSKIKSISIISYPSIDKYFIEISKNIPLTEKEISKENSKLVIRDFIVKNRVPFTMVQANVSDNSLYYFINPAKSVASPLIDKASIILPLIFFFLIILVIYRQSKGKGKYEVILPENISGSLDDLIGMDDLKKQIRPLIKKQESLDKNKAYNVNKTFNVMFSGPPGTGKTKFAGYLAKELGLPLISGSASSLETGLVGGGSGVLESLYSEAKKLKKCVVFLDEAQVLFIKRGPGSPLEGKHRDDTANTLLAILDGIRTSQDKDTEIYFVVASNFSDANMDMDPAMMRRFKLKLDFRLPNKEERMKMFKMFIDKIDQKYVADIDYKYLGEISTGLSPAHVETIVDLAAMSCADNNKNLETSDLYLAFEKNEIGNTNRETTANDNEKRKLIGIHELGHFMLEFDFLMDKFNGDLEVVQEKMSVLKISTESVSKLGALGYVLSKSEEVSLSTLDNLEADVRMLYGGLAAEKIFYGDRAITTGSSNDVQKATSILKAMIFEFGMYSKSKINYNLVNNEMKNALLMELMEKKSQELYEQSEEVILKRKGLIEFLNPILLDRYVLQIDEMMSLIKTYQKGS